MKVRKEFYQCRLLPFISMAITCAFLETGYLYSDAIKDLSGIWNSNIGIVYKITQKGNQFEWIDTKTNIKGKSSIQGVKVTTTWTDQFGAHSAEGEITSWDSTGRATEIRWNHGVIFKRTLETPGAGTNINIAGEWKSNIGLIYDITQTANAFEWKVKEMNETGKGIIIGQHIRAEWRGTSGGGSAEGKIEAIQDQATKITWNNGVIFTRSIDKTKSGINTGVLMKDSIKSKSEKPGSEDIYLYSEKENAVKYDWKITVKHRWGTSGYTWIGDFNGDGKSDIASAHGGNVHMLISTGSWFIPQTWSLPYRWGSSNYTWVGDFNRDKKTDIASAEGNRIYLHISEGHQFVTHTVDLPGTRWGNSGFTWVGDFNGDKNDDIASAYGGDIYMYLSTGNSFKSEIWKVTNQWGNSGYTRVADFSGNGKTDIASPIGEFIQLQLSLGNKFTTMPVRVANHWGNSGYTWVGDFNGDKKADIASADGGNILVRISTGLGFQDKIWPVPNKWGNSGYTWVGDFNGDGKTDIASASGGNIYMNLSNGNGFNHEIWEVRNQWGDSGYSRIGDFNGDGKTDIASANGQYVYVHLSSGKQFTSITVDMEIPVIAGTWKSNHGYEYQISQQGKYFTWYMANLNEKGSGTIDYSYNKWAGCAENVAIKASWKNRNGILQKAESIRCWYPGGGTLVDIKWNNGAIFARQ